MNHSVLNVRLTRGLQRVHYFRLELKLDPVNGGFRQILEDAMAEGWRDFKI